MGVLTPHLRIVMPYAQQGILTEAAATLGAYNTFALNSAFDPDFSGGGLQPLGFDQYAQFYGRYRVVKTRIELSFGSRTAGEPINVGMYTAAQSTLPAVATAWRIQPTPGCRYKMIEGPTGGPSIALLKSSVKMAQVMGVTSSEFHNDMDFAALFSASPARVAYLHIWIQSVTGNVGSCHWSLRMYQDIELSQPISLSLS